jgi:hypothetical protein
MSLTFIPEDPGSLPLKPNLEPMRPFPVELLPAPVKDYVLAQARGLVFDPAAVAIPVLSALAAAMGGTRRIQLKQCWTEPSVLWTALVSQADLRSALAAATAPLQELQQQSVPQFHQALSQYKRVARKIEADRFLVEQEGIVPKEPVAPVLQQYLINDWRLPPLLKSLPGQTRGTLLCTDKLDGWAGPS